MHNNRPESKRPILKYSLIGCGSIAVIVLSIIVWIAVSIFWGPGAMEKTSFHPFRSEEAQKRYLSHYDKRSKEWPIASQSRMIETSCGHTFVRISGPEDAPPLVLLPGGGCNMLIWLPGIANLSEEFRTYAVDNVYDFGRSVYTDSMHTSDDLAMWLDELFDKLGMEDGINLAGLSYGGWLAGEYALHAPERLNKVILLGPAATILPFRPEFIKKMIISMIPHRYFFKNVVYWSLEDAVKKDSLSKRYVDNHVEDAYLGLRCFKFKQPPSPDVLSDNELRSIKVPMLFLAGENEKVYDAGKAAARIKRIAPQIETAVLPGCGHDLWITERELVCDMIVEFLKKQQKI